MAEGRAPDLAVLDSVWAAEFAAAGFLYALEDLNEAWVHQQHEVDFIDALVAANRYEAGRSASAFADVAGLWYRRRELEETGLGVPSTWGELRSAARALLENGMPHPIVMPGGSRGGETTAYCLISFLASNGADVLVPEGVSLDSRKTARVRFLRSLVDDGLMSADVVGYEWDRPVRLLAEGEAAISFGGSYEAATLARALGVPLRKLWDHVGFAPIPGGPKGARERGRDDGVRDLPSGSSARARDAPPRGRRRAGGPRPYRHGHGPNTCPPVGCRARGAPAGIPEPDRRPPRPCGDAADHARLPARSFAPGDARGGAHGPPRPAAAAQRTAELIAAITGLRSWTERRSPHRRLRPAETVARV